MLCILGYVLKINIIIVVVMFFKLKYDFYISLLECLKKRFHFIRQYDIYFVKNLHLNLNTKYLCIIVYIILNRIEYY